MHTPLLHPRVITVYSFCNYYLPQLYFIIFYLVLFYVFFDLRDFCFILLFMSFVGGSLRSKIFIANN